MTWGTSQHDKKKPVDEERAKRAKLKPRLQTLVHNGRRYSFRSRFDYRTVIWAMRLPSETEEERRKRVGPRHAWELLGADGWKKQITDQTLIDELESELENAEAFRSSQKKQGGNGERAEEHDR